MTLSRTETASRWMQADLWSRGSINGGCADTSLRIASPESQFDPSLAGLFVNLVWCLQREHEDLDEYLGEPGRRTR